MVNAYAVSPITIEDIAAEVRQLRQKNDVSVLRRARENIVRYTVICVAMKGSLFKRLSQLRTAHGLLI
jgi:hypothetical protein